MKRILLLLIVAASCTIQARSQIIPCPGAAAKTANNFCIFLKWNGPAPSISILQNTMVIYTAGDLNNKDTVFTYLRGSGSGISIDSAAVFKNTTQGGTGACNANPSSINLTSLAGQILKFVYNNVTTSCLIGNPLPVVLSSFDTKLSATNEVAVTWTTAMEENINYFSVQRSTNGTDWKEVSRLMPANTSDYTHAYQYNDKLTTDITTQVYYRLVIIDYNGDATFSNTDVVKLKADNTLHISRVYPTLTSGVVKIEAAEENATISVTNIVGASLKCTAEDQGIVKTIDLASFPAGMYVLHIVSKYGRESFKILKQ